MHEISSTYLHVLCSPTDNTTVLRLTIFFSVQSNYAMCIAHAHMDIYHLLRRLHKIIGVALGKDNGKMELRVGHFSD